jgi:hypothetical protein
LIARLTVVDPVRVNVSNPVAVPSIAAVGEVAATVTEGSAWAAALGASVAAARAARKHRHENADSPGVRSLFIRPAIMRDRQRLR